MVKLVKRKKQRLLLNSIRDAAAGIKRKNETPQPQKRAHPTESSQRAGPSTTPATASSRVQHSPLAYSRCTNTLAFPNPEIIGDQPEIDFQHNPENPRADPRYNGSCDSTIVFPESFDPDTIEVIREMELEERATWLGKWFAHHYAPWVSEFAMKELETYQPTLDPLNPDSIQTRDFMVGPLPMAYHSFARFRIPEDEWRSPLFSSPFRQGLRRFRHEVVSTIRTYAIRIFGINDIATIADRENSPQVTALLHPENKFLYEGGDVRSMGQFMKSDCIVKALRVVLFGPAALDGVDKQKALNVRAVLFNVTSVRDCLTAFVATVLWFLLVDGGTFHDKGSSEGNKKYFEDRMKQLATLRTELPDIYLSYRKFMDAHVFGKQGEEANEIEKGQADYMKKFNADVERERECRRNSKGKNKDMVTPGSTDSFTDT